jgi:hypothetical protein
LAEGGRKFDDVDNSKDAADSKSLGNTRERLLKMAESINHTQIDESHLSIGASKTPKTNRAFTLKILDGYAKIP